MYTRLLAFNTYIVYSLITIIVMCTQIAACKDTPQDIKQLKEKAAFAEQQLKNAVAENKDVSAVIPKMKQVKVLADSGKIKSADTLLDEILLDFENLNATPNNAHSLFVNPKKVSIVGNPYSAMEPFISRDGEILFFNSDKSDDPKTEKNIYYATRINDYTFKFMGEVKGVNSNKVDGVPSMDIHNNFYFVSTIDYGKQNKFTTVYRGKFNNGEVINIAPIPELSLKKLGWLNMDIEISADGNTLYSTQNLFDGDSWPKISYFFNAHLENGKFIVNADSENIFQHINSNDLEYAASISTNELEIFFTRLKFDTKPEFSSFYANRTDKNSAFSKPVKINAITGYSEAPAITNDGNLLYFHKKVKDKFYIYALNRSEYKK